MNALLVGCGRIARRRVLPALRSMDAIERVFIASRTSAEAAWNNYDEALREFSGGLVYVSLPNSMHAEWARAALDRGCHVVVDKPACLDLTVASSLVMRAMDRRVVLAEATVWSWHPQVAAAFEPFADSPPELVNATFTFPGLDASDFRYKPELGGGSLFDQGPYAASCARVFLGGEPDEVECRVHSERHGVDASFSVMMSRGGRAMTGQFGMHMEYRNTVSLVGSAAAVDLERAFTTTAEQPATVRIRRKDASTSVQTGPADSFREFLSAVHAATASGSQGKFAETLLADAKTLHHMRVAARKAH